MSEKIKTGLPTMVRSEMLACNAISLEAKGLGAYMDYLKGGHFTVDSLSKSSGVAPELILKCLDELNKYGFVTYEGGCDEK